jgi:RND superfamily putative drug exporter
MQRQIAGGPAGRVTKWIVLAVWLVAFVGLGAFSSKLSDVQDNEAASRLPASAESTRALDKLEPFQDADAIPTVIVYEKDSGLTQQDIGAAQQQVADIHALDGVTGDIIGPYPSEDGRIAETTVTFNFGRNGWEHMPDTADSLRRISHIDGANVYITGLGGQAADSFAAFSGIDSTLLLAALFVVIVILLFSYRSPVLWMLPIFSVVVSLASSLGLVYLLAKYAHLRVNGETQAILSILVIGAGTDYALLLVARYREELRRHEDRHEAMALALRRAVPAILASAATVAVGMLCLLFAEMRSTAGLGPVTAIGVGITFLVMVTLLPALLVTFDRWIFWPLVPIHTSTEPARSGVWAQVGRRISVHPRAVWSITGALLLIACLGLIRLDANGLDSDEQFTKDFESVIGQGVLIDHDLVPSANPIMVAANGAKAAEVARALDRVDGVRTPSVPVLKGGVAFTSAALPGDPASQNAFDRVEAARAAVSQVDGADALVGGLSAMYFDTKVASTRDNLVVIPILLLVVFLILVLLLRALVAPLILIATVVLSFGAAMGISTLLFEYVFHFAGADAAFPLFAFVFLVALGIDYNIFLMTRVREEALSVGTRRGSLIALTSTGGVITSAGVVLAATFLVLGTLPLVFLAELGLTVAIGILLDTMIVRSVLVTAINLDLGGKIWWPSKLDRGTPSADTSRTEAAPAGV